MPQDTNLNTFPYFDDFDPNKNFYKVLFKPGYPLQARELTTVQSVLQNQIESFGNHIFKEGTIVIPGGVSYVNNLVGVQIQSTFNGIAVDDYIDNLLNRDIVGASSGVRARVVYILKANEDSNANTVLYLSLKSDGSSFNLNESILVDTTVSPGFSATAPIVQGQAFCNVLPVDNATIFGSAITVNQGVYYLRGYFINVPTESIILGWNSRIPSYSVGFRVFEEIVTADDDESLADNARGFSNYAAPGADRLKITTSLAKYSVSSFEETSFDKNYIEIFRVVNGEVKKLNRQTQYEELAKEFARRTYDESGDYYVTPFTIQVKNSLNDLKGNGGVYLPSQRTASGQTPGDNLGVYKISPGKAYVQGYEVESIGTELVDFEKPRSTKSLTRQIITYPTGSSYTLNRVYGSPSLEVDGSYTVSLRSERVGNSPTQQSGKEIGLARVYDFALESGSYDSNLVDRNEWGISLYDIQTYSELSLNEPATLTIPTHIEGKSSGAIAFLRYPASNSGIITAYGITGQFQRGERLIFNSRETDSRVSVAVTNYNTSDIKSLYGSVGVGFTFTADVKVNIVSDFGSATISASSGGISTVSLDDPSIIPAISVKKDDIIAYSSVSGITTFTYSKVVNTSDSTIIISGITTVPGICNGALPTTNISVSNVYALKSSFNDSSKNRLYATLPKSNIASVDLTTSLLTIRRVIDVSIVDNSVVVPPATLASDEFFTPYDEENYVLFREDGSFEALSQDKFEFSLDFKDLTIYGLGNNGNAKLIATITKTNVKEKKKNKVRVEKLIIDKSSNPGSGIGSSKLNDGLTYGNFPYGTRVQDKEICLNYPDVTNVYAILESSNLSDPQEPAMSLTDITGGTTDGLIFGEEIIGADSQTIAIYTGKINSTTINYVPINNGTFIEGEVITGLESNTSATINLLIVGDRNISNNFDYDQGQTNYIYDYSKIVRNNDKLAPTKKIKIIFERTQYSDSDDGDITTIESYRQFNWCGIPNIYYSNTGDIIDLRPRVDDYTISAGSRSPLEFLGRNFTATGNSSKHILASGGTILLDYSYYLGRIDKIYLSKDNLIQVKTGEPSDNPAPPEPVENALEVATINVPPYLCNPESASVKLTEHKRYRMKDIARLETRIQNLEYYTTLSLLEKNTSTLTVKDSNGIDRFKSGIFVDNFKTTTYQNKVTSVKNSIDLGRGELRPTHYTTEVDMVMGDNNLLNNTDTFSESYDSVYSGTSIVGNGVRRSGIVPGSTGKGVISLDYTDFVEINQPYSTRIENVTPYFVTVYEGIIDLNPSSDIWVDRVQLEPLTIEGITGEVTATQIQLSKEQIDSQAGWSPILWQSWADQWAGSY